MSDTKNKTKNKSNNKELKKNKIVSNSDIKPKKNTKNNSNNKKKTGTTKESSNKTSNKKAKILNNSNNHKKSSSIKKKTIKKTNVIKKTTVTKKTNNNKVSSNKKKTLDDKNIIVSSSNIENNNISESLEKIEFPNYEIEDFVEAIFKEIEVSETNNLLNVNNLMNNTIDYNEELINEEIIDDDKQDDSTTKVCVGGIDYQVSYKKVKVMKLKKLNLVLLIILISFVIIFALSFIKIFDWGIDNKKIEQQIENINNATEIVEVVDEENISIIDSDVDYSNPYWDYIKMNLIDVDINDLKEMNNETKGWIQVNGTNINYPFVQTVDNDFYLTHSFDKTYNEAGWVFLDYRNDLTKEEKNTIIYAHSRIDRSMFGSLKNILTSDWLNKPDNYIIKLSTQYENTLWQIFSVYHIPTTVDYLKTKFPSDEQFLDFSTMLLERSQFNFNTNILSTDRILTLSTCYNNTEKVVLHAKLIKSIKKIP